MSVSRANYTVIVIVGLFCVGVSPLNSNLPLALLTNGCLAQDNSEGVGGGKDPDIQWFREKMKISPKYVDREEGILGMSWGHFLTMLFLVLFFVFSIVALVIRHRRTKQLLELLVKKEEKGGT